jgi:hypothetical protein
MGFQFAAGDVRIYVVMNTMRQYISSPRGGVQFSTCSGLGEAILSDLHFLCSKYYYSEGNLFVRESRMNRIREVFKIEDDGKERFLNRTLFATNDHISLWYATIRTIHIIDRSLTILTHRWSFSSSNSL